MPIYSYRCLECNQVDEHVLPIKERDGLQLCSVCNNAMYREMGVPHFKMTISDYEAARKVMEDDQLTRDPAVVKSAMKRIHYDRSVFQGGLCT